jgi:hypothetical protein
LSGDIDRSRPTIAFSSPPSSLAPLASRWGLSGAGVAGLVVTMS